MGQLPEKSKDGECQEVLATCRWRGLLLSLGTLDVVMVWKTMSFGEVLWFPICNCLGVQKYRCPVPMAELSSVNASMIYATHFPIPGHIIAAICLGTASVPVSQKWRHSHGG